MNESIHSVSSHDCRFLPNRMRGGSLVITRRVPSVLIIGVDCHRLLTRPGRLRRLLGPRHEAVAPRLAARRGDGVPLVRWLPPRLDQPLLAEGFQ